MAFSVPFSFALPYSFPHSTAQSLFVLFNLFRRFHFTTVIAFLRLFIF